MSEENVEIMHRAYDAYNCGDLRAFGEMLDPDVTWQPDPSWPELRARQGREEVLQLLEDIREPLEKNEAVAEKLVDAGDRIVILHVWRGVLKGTEDQVEGRLGLIVTFRAGKATEVRYFPTFDDALEAAGLAEVMSQYLPRYGTPSSSGPATRSLSDSPPLRTCLAGLRTGLGSVHGWYTFDTIELQETQNPPRIRGF